ncbi:hypothetical protein Tco_1265843 [Tanacetum coccineum]
MMRTCCLKIKLNQEKEKIKLEFQKLFNSIKATQAQNKKDVDEYAYAEVRAQNQDLLMTISKLKNKLSTIEKGKHVNTNFDKSKTLGNSLCVTLFNKNLANKAKNVSNTKVPSNRSKPVTSYSTPKGVESSKSVRRPKLLIIMLIKISTPDSKRASNDEKEVQAIKEIERRLQEKEMQQQESLVLEGTTMETNFSSDITIWEAITKNAAIEACLVTEGAALESCLVNEGITINDITGVTESSEKVSENSSSETLDRNKEGHDDVDYEQQCKFLATLINNLKCDVEKCNEANHEAQQANALLSNELEKYKEKEKHFANDKTIESEYCKKIKLLNDEISNLKAQACEKDKTFAMENENYDEFVKPLLNSKNELEKKNQEFLKQINDLDNRLQKVGQTDQTLRMLLPKDGNVNTGK